MQQEDRIYRGIVHVLESFTQRKQNSLESTITETWIKVKYFILIYRTYVWMTDSLLIQFPSTKKGYCVQVRFQAVSVSRVNNTEE